MYYPAYESEQHLSSLLCRYARFLPASIPHQVILDSAILAELTRQETSTGIYQKGWNPLHMEDV